MAVYGLVNRSDKRKGREMRKKRGGRAFHSEVLTRESGDSYIATMLSLLKEEESMRWSEEKTWIRK